MKDTKKLPANQLEKYSTVFTQLGLVLTLFIVFALLEHQTEQKNSVVAENYFNPDDVFIIDEVPKFIKKEVLKKKPIPVVKPQPSTDLSNLEKVKDITKTVETVIDTPTEEPQFNMDKVPTVPEPEIIKGSDEPKSFNFIEEAPIYKGCEGLSKEENKKCFVRKITKHVQRHFNSWWSVYL